MTSRPDDPAPYYRAHVFACVNERPAGHKRGSCKERGAEPLRTDIEGTDRNDSSDGGDADDRQEGRVRDRRW